MKKISEEKILQVNPFEDRISPTALLACVGDNSGVPINSRDCAIIDGYKDSVDYLMEKIYSQEATTDILVYPLLFCCRHSVELSFKVLIKNLIIIYKRKKSISTTDDFIQDLEISLKEHDIAKLVESINKLKVVDKEIENVINEIEYFDECIRDYFFDVNGDSFRYTFKRNLKDTNLESIRIIDLGVFYKKYSYLMKQFDYLINYFCHWLDYQYRNKSFTKHLNRNQIEEISEMLPNKSEWKSDDFKKIKKEICQKYNISNSEFSKIIDMIENHYKFCTNIGMEKKFKDIKEETFEKLGKLISENKNKNRLVPKSFRDYFEVTDSHRLDYFAQTFGDEAKKVFKSIAQEEKLVFLSFYEVSLICFDGIYQCEELDVIYNSWVIKSPTEDYIISKICSYLVNKRIRDALDKCGQITYLNWFDKYITPYI